MRTLFVAVNLTAAAVLWSLGPIASESATEPAGGPDWSPLAVPGVWDEARPDLATYDGFAWYRCKFVLPAGWKGERIELRIERVDNAHEAYVNGSRVGGAGELPPKYASGLERSDRYPIDPAILRFGEPNVVAIRVYDHDGRGGFKGPAPAIVGENQGIWLAGAWEFRTGDDLAWAKSRAADIGDAALRRIALPAFKFRELAATADDVLSPRESIGRMTIADDLEVACVLVEPVIRQPVAMHFDPRGRLWVVNYEQYPNPAGLKMLSRDQHWRAVYDKVPLPPPHGVKGRDRITIHEDVDGDGDYDEHSVFLDDLNITTACAVGAGGVWVMNPPFLLFYPDADGDDVPDGDPVVHLEGFGLEDTHSCANSLTWGPDGWLYATQGSTVSGNIRKPGEKQATFSMGQNVWRYHPATRTYEIFAEGGGNSFGIAFDDDGRLFSGHNGGDTRGFHYVQGGYYRKGFGKHGPLSNPFALGYFEDMQHPAVERFTHDFVIYGDESPVAKLDRLRGNLVAVEPLQGRIVRSEISDDGSTFRTVDLDRPIVSSEKRFRPVNIEVGPWGFLYVADFHEPQISHREHFSGIVENTTGRIYRIGGTGSAMQPFDLPSSTTDQLVDVLRDGDRFRRDAALRMIATRNDPAVVERLRASIDDDAGPFALHCLWALHQTAGLQEAEVTRWTAHPYAAVREWVVRLSCDSKQISAPLAARFATLAVSEPDVRVRSQLACSARRLPTEQCLPIVRALLARDVDAGDPHLPLLLWWAIEAKCATDGDAVLALFEEESLWSRPIVRETILERLAQRFAQPGTRRELLAVATLLDRAPDEGATQRLMAGFERAFAGRTLTGLPDELVAALARSGGGSLSLRVRQREAAAIDEALARIGDDATPADERVGLIATLGEVGEARAVEPLLALITATRDARIRTAALGALGGFDEPRIGTAIVALVPAEAGTETDDQSGTNDVRDLALSLLAGRAPWSAALLDALEADRLEKSSIPLAVVRKMTLHRDEPLVQRVRRHWPDVEGASDAAMKATVARFAEVVVTAGGDPFGGKQLFAKSCGKCHQLFGEGGRIGPDLTPFKRDDHVNLLINVVNPSAEIREGFETWIVVTDEGRVVTGFLQDRDEQLVVLRTAEGQDVRIPTAEIDDMRRTRTSVMPTELLAGLNDQQVRDLFAYLRSAQPLN